MKLQKRHLPVLFLFFLFSCTKGFEPAETTDNPAPPTLGRTAVTAAATSSITENFEAGTKTSYTASNITLGSGPWNFNDALLGNSSSDKKNNTQSARIRNSGVISMLSDLTTGASTITILHARYGTDGNSAWQLWYSTNGGSSWLQAGSTITASSTSLTAATFTVNIAGTIRFEIRKTDGSTNRLNIDDINFTNYSTGGGGTGGKKFLFDAKKGETSGNADWVIDEDNNTPQRIPTPLQSSVTASTGETFWTGALSSWGIALARSGNTVETLASTGTITYGNTSNVQDLSNYNVFVIDEPNIRFTAAEKAAILNFVKNGGGLFMIADHTISDRNGDGWDSPAIWNDLMTNNGSVNNPFGFSIDLTNISEISSNVSTNATTSAILHGSQGDVTKLEFNNGATITINTSVNPNVLGLVWQNGFAQNSTHIMSASSTYGTGRVFIITDSSPMDDGTGAANNLLFVSWPLYSHTALFMNASLWLAKLQ